MKKSIWCALLVMGVLSSAFVFAEDENNTQGKKEKPNYITACASSQENAACSYTKKRKGTSVSGTCIRAKNHRGKDVMGCSTDGKTLPAPKANRDK